MKKFSVWTIFNKVEGRPVLSTLHRDEADRQLENFGRVEFGKNHRMVKEYSLDEIEADFIRMIKNSCRLVFSKSDSFEDMFHGIDVYEFVHKDGKLSYYIIDTDDVGMKTPRHNDDGGLYQYSWEEIVEVSKNWKLDVPFWMIAEYED